MDRELVLKAESFLKETFGNSAFLQEHPEMLAYRLEHSCRVANLCGQIAKAEGFDETALTIAGLLHDISYSQEMSGSDQWKNHGRKSAILAQPFLRELGLPGETVMDMLYGIAIHVDDDAGFQWRRTAFAETVGDADNIDRFDVYRIYETLEYKGFSKLSLPEKQEIVQTTLGRLKGYREMKLATKTATELWQTRLDYYISFYEKLGMQLENSLAIL